MYLITFNPYAWSYYKSRCSWEFNHWSLLLIQQYDAIQSLSRVWLFATPWTAALQASLSFTIFWSMLKLMSFESVMPSNYLVLCHPLLLPSIFPSIRVFSNELALHIRWPKYWTFSFSIILEPFNFISLLWPKMCQLQLQRLAWILRIPDNAEGWVGNYYDFFTVLKVDLVTFCPYKTLV